MITLLYILAGIIIAVPMFIRILRRLAEPLGDRERAVEGLA